MQEGIERRWEVGLMAEIEIHKLVRKTDLLSFDSGGGLRVRAEQHRLLADSS